LLNLLASDRLTYRNRSPSASTVPTASSRSPANTATP